MKQRHRSALVAVGITLTVALAAGGAGCKEASDTGGAAAEKAAQEAAITDLKEPVALIAAYKPHLLPPEGKDKFAPKQSGDADKATICASNEIRHAANGVKQKLERRGAASTKELEGALRDVSVACADAVEVAAVEKCLGTVAALDAALKKIGDASAAAGVTGKFPRIAPEAITDEAKKSIAPYLKAKGLTSTAEADFLKKRGDPAAGVGDVIGACQAAVGDATAVASQYEKADEPIRLIAVTHKMAIESQCNALNAAEALQKELEACKKKAKSTECKIVCSKVKAIVDDGVRAAAFTPLEKEHAEICKE